MTTTADGAAHRHEHTAQQTEPAPSAYSARGRGGMPSVCPVCGALSLVPEGDRSILLAVCDVLVMKALEVMGKHIVRAERSRFNALRGRPFTEAYMIWTPTVDVVARSLDGAWDVVPPLLETHGCDGVSASDVPAMLDDYVHDLAMTGEPHRVEYLRRLFESRLGLPIYDRTAQHSTHSTHETRAE